MRVLLISANTFSEPYPVYPLGLDYVAGALGGRHHVTILDMNTLGGLQELAEKVRDALPDAVGVSLRNIDNTDVADSEGFIAGYREIITAIRSATGAPVILGGSGYTLFPDTLLRELGADFGVIGEGERIAPLLDALSSGASAGTIPGIASPGVSAPIPPPWDGPVRRDFDPHLPHPGYYLKRGGMLNLQTKRGCPYRCVYCTYPHIEGSLPRLSPPEEVADTALALQKAGARYLFITDSVFNSSEGHCEAVAEAFIKKGVAVPWGAYFSPVSPAKGFFALLKRAGLTHAEFGTESLSGTMLKNYAKPFTAGEAAEAHRAAVAAGVHAAHFMLLGGPGEDAATVTETLAAAERLEKAVIFFFCGIRIYPFTGLYRTALDEGVINAGDDLLEPVFYRSAGIDSERIMAMVAERAKGRTNWIFGSGGDRMTAALRKMYRRGHSGPLWEHLIG